MAHFIHRRRPTLTRHRPGSLAVRRSASACHGRAWRSGFRSDALITVRPLGSPPQYAATSMRVAVWNMERGGPGGSVAERQLQLLDGMDFDLAVVTEPPAACSMTCDGVVAAPALRIGHAGPEAWVSVMGTDVQPVPPCPPFERLAVAARAYVGTQLVIVYGSVLPWRSAPTHVPSLALPGESAAAMFERFLEDQVADVNRLRTAYPTAVVLWAGDFNQSLEGPNLVGSARGRALLEQALEHLGLVAWNRDAGHAKEGLSAIDLVCGPRECACITVEQIAPELGGRQLSDHAGYVVDVELR